MKNPIFTVTLQQLEFHSFEGIYLEIKLPFPLVALASNSVFRAHGLITVRSTFRVPLMTVEVESSP